MMLILFCVVALAAKAASEGCHFGYVGEHGVDHWGEDYNECLGKHQSPINIDSKHVTLVKLPPFSMHGFDHTPSASLTNNGHTALMAINSETQPTISGGPLCGVYEFAQLHFHWGDDDSCGGENEIDDKQYPLEMHMVFFKKEYLDFNSALNHPDGLTVLGCLFEIEETDNKDYKELIQTMDKLTQPVTVDSQTIDSPPSLFQLMPLHLSSYFTYNGSLTTPPCTESVIWIDFDQTVKISHAQLQVFRSLTDSECNRIVSNFRAIQPLGDRVVLYCKDEIDEGTRLSLLKKIADKVLEIYKLLSSLI